MAKQLGAQILSNRAWEAIGLKADGPFPGMEEKLALFGQFVGDWDILEDRYLKPDCTWAVGRGELHWRWILNGRGVRDVRASI